jgi:uncharacterized protein
MVVGVSEIHLEIPGCRSLKEKRRALQPAIARVRNTFNVSIAEVDLQDHWQLATLGVACVSSSAEYVHGLLERVVQAIEGGHEGLVLLEYSIEML